MCSQRKIYSMHMNAKCERFKLKFIVKNQRSAIKYAMRKANRLPRTNPHTHTHTSSCSLAHRLLSAEQEASIIQNIRNFERLSTIAPSSANHAQFVKIISSLLTTYFFFFSPLLASLHFLYPTYPLGDLVRNGSVSWEIGRGLLSKLHRSCSSVQL